MNILFLSSWYPTDKNPNFGVFVKEHAHAIHATENKIVMLAIVIQRDNKIFETKIIDKFDELGMRVVLIEVNTIFRDIIYQAIPIQYLLVKKVFKKRIHPDFRPDIIHSNVIFPAGIIGYWLSKYLNLPHIITEHWSRIKGFISKPVLGGLARKAYENASSILPVSSFLKKNILEIIPTLPPSKLHVIGNVIDSKTFFYKEKNKPIDLIKFCAVATWTNKRIPDKMPEIFIEALAKLQESTQQMISLTMIGGGDRIEELKKLCVEMRLKTEFLGFQQKRMIAKILQESDYFVHASTIETFGVVVAESLICGTPVICSNVGALPELIDETNGVLCENTVEDWVKGLKIAVNEKFDNNKISNNIEQKYSLIEIGKELHFVYSRTNKTM